MSDPVVVDETLVVGLYVGKGLSMRQVGVEMGIGGSVVRRVLVAHQIPIRGRAESVAKIDCDELRRLYIGERLSSPAMAACLGVSVSGVGNAMRRCGIGARPGSTLTIRSVKLQEHLDEGMSNTAIAARYGVAPWAVVRRLRQEVMVRSPKLDYYRPAPPGDELRSLYVDEGSPITDIAARYQVPASTVRRWLGRASIDRRTTNYVYNPDGAAIELTPELLRDLYVDQEWTAAEIGSHVGVSKKIVLARLHGFGIAVRPPGARRPGTATPLLDRLYADPAIMAVLERHGVPVVEALGPLRSRFADPPPLTQPLIRDLYVGVGLSVSHISLLTGHGGLGVRTALQQAGIVARPGKGRSPWTKQNHA